MFRPVAGHLPALPSARSSLQPLAACKARASRPCTACYLPDRPQQLPARRAPGSVQCVSAAPATCGGRQFVRRLLRSLPGSGAVRRTRLAARARLRRLDDGAAEDARVPVPLTGPALARRVAWRRLRHSKHDREILAVLVPAMLAIFLDPVMALIDTAVVGRLGTVQLGAQGLSNMMFFFCTVFFSFLLVVTTPKVAGAVAANNPREASRATAQALWLALGCGGALAVALWLGAPWLMQVVRADAAVAAQAVGHLRIRALACPAVLLMYVCTGAFRGFKDTRTPLYAGMAGNATNLLLDFSLVICLGCGLAGAATAATTAQYIYLAVLLAFLLRRGMLRRSDLARPPTGADLRPFVVPGLSLGVCIGAVMTAVMGATAMATGLGATALAAHTIVKQIVDFCLNIFGAFNTVAQSLVAAALGKADKREARGVLVRVLQLGAGMGTLVGAALLGTQGRLPYLFSSDEAVVSLARTVLPFMAFVLPLCPAQTSLEGALLGALEVGWVARRTVLSAVCAVSLLVYAHHAHLGLLGVWLGLISLSVVNGLADVWRLLRADSPLGSGVLESGAFESGALESIEE